MSAWSDVTLYACFPVDNVEQLHSIYNELPSEKGFLGWMGVVNGKLQVIGPKDSWLSQRLPWKDPTPEQEVAIAAALLAGRVVDGFLNRERERPDDVPS